LLKTASILADIGNTYIHIFDGKSVVHLPHEEAIERYGNEKILYISVNESLESRIRQKTRWQNVNEHIVLPGAYDTMGVDRKALCLSHDNGVFVDAGSAITVDVMREGVYMGGYIFPGIQAMLESYRRISPALDVALYNSVDLSRLPLTTKEQISYGIIASIKALIEKHQHNLPLYLTGGDGAFLADFFHHAHYDEALVFKGLQYALKADKNHTQR
jgi:type III pantothenate kinase